MSKCDYSITLQSFTYVNLLLNDSSFYDDWLWLNIVTKKLLVCFYHNNGDTVDALFMLYSTKKEGCKYYLAFNSTITNHIIILFCLANLEGFLEIIKLYCFAFYAVIKIRSSWFAFHTISILQITECYILCCISFSTLQKSLHLSIFNPNYIFHGI